MGTWIHRISNIRPELKIADCAGCGQDAPIVYKSNKASWRCKAGDRRSTHDSERGRQLRYRFGIDAGTYAALLEEQGGTCGICEEPCPSGRQLAVDHDHATGAVRGLLCGRCNTALGLMRDRPELLLRAVQYLAIPR